jgi:6-phosphogluconolactonase
MSNERPVNIREFSTRAEASAALAAELVSVLESVLEAGGHPALIVSGGSSPLQLFHRLSEYPIDWPRVRIVPSDERDVPLDHPERNESMIRRELLRDEAAGAELISLLPPGDIPRSFDAVVLGMGDDGHTASLFPDSPDLSKALSSDGPLVRLAVPRLAKERISLTPAALLNTRALYLLFFGEKKRAVLDAALDGSDTGEYPVRVVLNQVQVPLTVYYAP